MFHLSFNILRNSIRRNICTHSQSNYVKINNEKDLNIYINKLNEEVKQLNNKIYEKNKLIREANIRKELKLFNYDKNVIDLLHNY